LARKRMENVGRFRALAEGAPYSAELGENRRIQGAMFGVARSCRRSACWPILSSVEGLCRLDQIE
jgi:hypothetical protein